MALGPGILLSYESPYGLSLPFALHPGETIIWVGKPLRRLYFWQSLAALIVGSPLSGLGIWLMIKFSDLVLPMLGFSGFFFGIYLVTLPVRMWRRAGGTIYAVTDRRAIIHDPAQSTPQSYSPESLKSMSCAQRIDGSGDLIFEHHRQGASGRRLPLRKGFLAVANVRGVEKVILDMLVQSRTAERVDL